MIYPNPDDQHGFIPVPTGQVLVNEECFPLIGEEMAGVVADAIERAKERGPLYFKLVPMPKENP